MKNNQFAIVLSEFNSNITDKLLEGAMLRFADHHIPLENIKLVKVPGAIEIPLMAKILAQSKKYHAIVCLGSVIRGDTSHYDYVCQNVSQGCLQVSLQCELPVIFGVLTTDDEAQALERVGGAHGHKGADAVDAAIKMVSLINALAK